jgi:hypothetical protein
MWLIAVRLDVPSLKQISIFADNCFSLYADNCAKGVCGY